MYVVTPEPLNLEKNVRIIHFQPVKLYGQKNKKEQIKTFKVGDIMRLNKTWREYSLGTAIVVKVEPLSPNAQWHMIDCFYFQMNSDYDERFGKFKDRERSECYELDENFL